MRNAKDLSGFDDRLLASFVLGSPDYDAQLYAIRGLLRLHRQADEALSNEIKGIEAFAEQASGSANERAVDEWVDHLHQSVFQDAAHSMAAVGMLAPFIESLFKQAFPGIRDLLDRNGRVPIAHVRWTMPKEKQWECGYTSRDRKDLVNGIAELAEATGLAADLPTDLHKTLAALFAYRNKMFHLGFEWPDRERNAFERKIVASGWPQNWFSQATSDGKPWIFYVRDTFVRHCLTMIDQIFAGLGAFVRRNDCSSGP